MAHYLSQEAVTVDHQEEVHCWIAISKQNSNTFNSEKVKLLNLINELHEQKDKEQWKAHPIFGHFTKAQWGQMQYKHLDHHLNQFGV